jgi:hypothetical protein
MVKLRQRIALLVAAIGLGLYVAAKVHYFTAYDPFHVGPYLEHHSLYWLGLAAVGAVLWFLTKNYRS